MRALAALAALHVILACPAGECDGVEMLQGSMSHRQESAAIQLSAMVHDGKHNKPEAKHGRKHRKPEAKHGTKHKQSAVSAPSPPSPTEKEIEEKKNWYKMMELALLLAQTRDTCKVFGDEQCLPLLKAYRRHAWPFIEKELGKNLTRFRPKGPQGMRTGWRPFFVKTRLQGCVQRPVIYMQVKGVNAKTVVTNLRKYSRPGAIKTGQIEKKDWRLAAVLFNFAISRATKNKKTVGVTFVRDPLERFISAYEDLVAAKRRQPNRANGSDATLLEDEKSSTERARLFIESFLQGGGKDITASLLPQSEYFAETAHNCSARISFIGKSESPADEWRRMIHGMGCDPTKIPYLNGTKTTGRRGQKANKTSSLLQVSSGATSGMEKTMKLDNAAYLRAWCWFSMPDYVLFRYDLPAECHDIMGEFVV